MLSNLARGHGRMEDGGFYLSKKSGAVQNVSKGCLHRFAILSRQRPELADNQGVVQGEELESDLARNLEPGLPPALNCHVARPVAPG